MSQRELYEWYEYYSQEPFIADRLEQQLATIGYLASSFGGGKSKHEDFMITGKKKEKQTLKEFEDDLKAKFMPFAKKKK